MLENAKFANLLRKRYWNIIIYAGTSPADFSTAGDASPRPPPPTGFDAHDRILAKYVPYSESLPIYQIIQQLAKKSHDLK